MHRLTFTTKNILDKTKKSIGSWQTTRFYFNTYIRSKINAPEPDYYLVSYPKCGRTWLRIMLQQYLRLLNLEQQQPLSPALLPLPGNALLKFDHDHGNWVPAPKKPEQMHFDASKYAGKPVAFMLRHPGDVLSSSWYHLKYRENIYTKDLSHFIREQNTGIHKVIAFMNMWLENQDKPGRFMLIRYETLKASPHPTFRNLLEYFGLELNEQAVEEAIARSSFSNMKRMEQSGALKEPWMRPGKKGTDKAMKIRKGKSGSYLEELNETDIRYIEEAIAQFGHPQLREIYGKQ